ncbi:MAG TPA: hypothetical protein VGT04_13275 [Acidobacteriaceae bacterium]|nr:hypothetical protein [Acidobacteriaceae bacterium]
MIEAKRCPMRLLLGISLIMLGGMLPSASAQKTTKESPLVVAGDMPLYPIMARVARVQGVVKIKVTTDGKKVIAVEAEGGPPMLVKFAKEDILTWRFAEHKPTTFITKFDYVIEEPFQCDFSNDTLVLKLPFEVQISAEGLETCDPALEIRPHP